MKNTKSEPSSLKSKKASKNGESSKPATSKSKSKSKVVTATAAPTLENEKVRLHITPLTPATASSIVPNADLASISFHDIPTFPEKSYAFVDLLKDDAEKAKKKYHGTVFRGVKMNVEEAKKPRKTRSESTSKESDTAVDGKRKRRASDDTNTGTKNAIDKAKVLSGAELPNDRSVQRGWQKQTASKNKIKPSSSIDTKAECLFKTVLPPVIANNLSASKSSSTHDASLPKSAKTKTKKNRVYKNQVILKEFDKNTNFPQFLKINNELGSSEKADVEYKDGVGWVDEDGNVVDDSAVKRRKLNRNRNHDGEAEVNLQQNQPGVTVSSQSIASESESSADSKSESEASTQEGSADNENSENSSSSEELSGASEDGQEDSDEANPAEDVPIKVKKSVESKTEKKTETREKIAVIGKSPLSKVVTVSSNQDEPEAGGAGEATEKSAKGGLAALFKPKISITTEFNPKFRFFDDDGEEKETEGLKVPEEQNDEMDIDTSNVPVTPFRKRYRSMAPTPDTAVAPRFGFNVSDDSPVSPVQNTDYFPPPQLSKSIDLDLKSNDQSGMEKKLLFVHGDSKFLHSLSIWNALPVPKILTTVDVDEQDSPLKNTKQVLVTKTEVIEPKIKQKDDYKYGDETSDWVSTKARTGVGSGVVGWAGKKMKFDDNDEDDSMNIAKNVEETTDWTSTKARTGAGSGVVGWAGRKKKFDEDDEDDSAAIVQQQPKKPLELPKPKSKTLINSAETLKPIPTTKEEIWQDVFYKNRGEWNREWKKRKRDVAKMKRKKDGNRKTV